MSIYVLKILFSYSPLFFLFFIYIFFVILSGIFIVLPFFYVRTIVCYPLIGNCNLHSSCIFSSDFLACQFNWLVNLIPINLVTEKNNLEANSAKLDSISNSYSVSLIHSNKHSPYFVNKA